MLRRVLAGLGLLALLTPTLASSACWSDCDPDCGSCPYGGHYDYDTCHCVCRSYYPPGYSTGGGQSVDDASDAGVTSDAGRLD